MKATLASRDRAQGRWHAVRNYTADHVSTRTYTTQAALTLATDGLVCGRIEGSTERGSRQRHTPTSDFTERLRTQASFFHSGVCLVLLLSTV